MTPRQVGLSVSTLLDDLARSTREASRIAGLLSDASRGSLTRQQTSLLGMIAGNRQVDGIESVGWPVEGARVLFARTTGQHPLSFPSSPDAGHHNYVTAPIDAGSLVVLVKSRPRSPSSQRRDCDVLAVGDSLRSQQPGVFVGASSPLLDSAAVPDAYREAVDAAEVAEEMCASLVLADEMWAELAMFRIRRGFGRTLPASNPVERLRAYDLAKGRDLAQTLLAWLVNNCEISATSTALSLHPNTLRYRLRRAADIAGFDLTDPEHRMLLHLSLGMTATRSK